jgi:hypothetical protein
LGISGIDTGMKSFNFELNVFNLAKLTNNSKIVLKTIQQPLLLSKGPEWPRDNEKTMLTLLKQLADKHCSYITGRNPGKFLQILTFYSRISSSKENESFPRGSVR